MIFFFCKKFSVQKWPQKASFKIWKVQSDISNEISHSLWFPIFMISIAKNFQSKNRISASETSKKHNLQKWTPLSSRSPLSKVMSILWNLVNLSVLSWFFCQVQSIIRFLFIWNPFNKQNEIYKRFSSLKK